MFSILAGCASAEEVVRITAGEWPPYLGSDLPHFGIAGRIITEAFATQGITVEMTFFPFANRIQVYPQEVNVGYTVLNDKFSPGERALITHNDMPFLQQYSYLLLTKRHERNARLIKAFNTGLDLLVGQGKAEEYFDEFRQRR